MTFITSYTMVVSEGDHMTKIVSDTSTLYSIEQGLEKGLYIVPLNITVDNRSYKDFEDITSEQLLQMIHEHKIPHTSQPSLGEKIDIYNKLTEDDEVIDITMASGLSGTYHTALTAKASCDHPEKVHVIDSMTLCGPHRLLVDKALEMANKNKSPKEILDKLEAWRKTEISYLIPFDFDFLVRGGRIRGVAAKLGGLLKIIPILKKGEHGEGLHKHDICRTIRKTIDSVITDLQKNGVNNSYTFYVSHADNESLAEAFRTTIHNRFDTSNIFVYPLSPSFITQGGPKCVAIQVIDCN